MKTSLYLAGAVIALGLVAGVPAASAQSLIFNENGLTVVPPGGQEVPPPRGYDNQRPRHEVYDEIGPRQARRIARSAGMVQTYDVGRRGGVWIVRGEDRRGRDLRVVISARNGDIVNVDRRG
jgi:hypothetical protein